jgi:hypothetical protein
MFGRKLDAQRPGRPVSAGVISEAVGAAQRLMKLRVGAGLGMQWVNGTPLIWAVPPLVLAHFWTTATIALGSKSGTTVSNSTLHQGSGTARRCLYDADADVVKPDVSTGAADETIYNDLAATGSTIPSGTFVLCALVGTRWVVILAPCA